MQKYELTENETATLKKYDAQYKADTDFIEQAKKAISEKEKNMVALQGAFRGVAAFIAETHSWAKDGEQIEVDAERKTLNVRPANESTA